jgi:hypothetical protein
MAPASFLWALPMPGASVHATMAWPDHAPPSVVHNLSFESMQLSAITTERTSFELTDHICWPRIVRFLCDFIPCVAASCHSHALFSFPVQLSPSSGTQNRTCPACHPACWARNIGCQRALRIVTTLRYICSTHTNYPQQQSKPAWHLSVRPCLARSSVNARQSAAVVSCRAQ